VRRYYSKVNCARLKKAGGRYNGKDRGKINGDGERKTRSKGCPVR